ncbi:MAG: Integral membrane protein TerC [Candidatus Peribacteria bacterium GW2011_GWB1_54_5]|nr:MAG: Integral membrane protein TerC [Candidatus Peribacteria bacterium GW2011_GWB1_54_5]
MSPRLILEIAFAVIIVGFLIVDLGILNRKAHAISVRAAAWQSIFWITISVIFAWCIFLFYDATKSMEFLSAYATEKMLSVDNLFVILLIFNFFSIEEKYQHRVLFYGILGAIIMRAVFIGLGSVVVSMFHWILYIFGAMLVYAGFKLFFEKKEEHIDFHNNKMYRLAHRLFHFSSNHHGGHFIVREAPRPYGRGISLASPAFLHGLTPVASCGVG